MDPARVFVAHPLASVGCPLSTIGCPGWVVVNYHLFVICCPEPFSSRVPAKKKRLICALKPPNKRLWNIYGALGDTQTERLTWLTKTSFGHELNKLIIIHCSHGIIHVYSLRVVCNTTYYVQSTSMYAGKEFAKPNFGNGRSSSSANLAAWDFVFLYLTELRF